MIKLGAWVAAALLGATLCGGAAGAATIGFDDAKPGFEGVYSEAAYAFDPVRIVNGGCLSGPCLALNDREAVTVARADGGLFDARSITFSLIGKGEKKAGGNALVLTTDAGVSLSLSSGDFRRNAFHTVTLDPALFSGLRSLVFASSGGGNVRIDGFDAGAAAPLGAVPLPAGGWLLLAGLGALGAVRRRRR